MVKNPFKFNTGLGATDTKNRSESLIEMIKQPILHAGIGTEVNLSTIFPADNERSVYPVIVILNGTGGVGKGTFAKMVSDYSQGKAVELSTVDPLRPIADQLIKTYSDNYKDLYIDPPMTAKENVDIRSDKWRTLMHDLKSAWQNIDDAPNLYLLGKVVRIITTSNEDTMPGIIFVNIRESENIEKFRQYCYTMGLLCFSLLVDGKIDPNTISNDSDKNVYDYTYDITVYNKGNLDDLSIIAFIFEKFVNRANRSFGISVMKQQNSDIVIDTNNSKDDTITTDVEGGLSESSRIFSGIDTTNNNGVS